MKDKFKRDSLVAIVLSRGSLICKRHHSIRSESYTNTVAAQVACAVSTGKCAAVCIKLCSQPAAAAATLCGNNGSYV